MTSHTPRAPAGSGRDGQLMPWPPLTKRLRPGNWLAIDCVIAVLLAVVFLVGSTRPAYGIPIWVAYVFALVSTVPVAVRRLWPLPVLSVVLAGSVAAMAIGTGKDPAGGSSRPGATCQYSHRSRQRPSGAKRRR